MKQRSSRNSTAAGNPHACVGYSALQQHCSVAAVVIGNPRLVSLTLVQPQRLCTGMLINSIGTIHILPWQAAAHVKSAVDLTIST